MNLRVLTREPAEAVSGSFHRMDLTKDDVGVLVIHRPGTSLTDIAINLLELDGVAVTVTEQEPSE